MSAKEVIVKCFKGNKLIIALVLIILSSCTSTIKSPPISSPASFSSSQQRNWLNSLTTWQANGRFAVKRQNQGWSGSFEWTQISKENYQIHFYGPFGAGNAYLNVTPQQAIWKDSEGITTAESPNILFTTKTNFIFPVSDIYDWILGRAAPIENITPPQTFDPQGRLIYLNQDYWYIRYLSYRPVGQGELPAKIEMEMPSEALKIKIIIDQWKVNSIS